MGTSDRIERERQAKRALILEAARELFLERGYEAVTLRSVAERIEHSTTAVYVHFKDKRDLVDQMVREDFGTFDAALLAKAAVQPAMERLEQLGEAYIEFALRLPRHYQLLFLTPRPDVALDEAAHAPAPEGGPTEHGARGFMLLLTTVQACIDEGAFEEEHRDALGIAQAVWAAVHGLVSLLIIMGKEAHFQWRAPEVLYQMLMGSMLRGMRREPRGAREASEAREASQAPVAPRPAAAKREAAPAAPRPAAAKAAAGPAAAKAAAATARGSGRGKRTGR